MPYLDLREFVLRKYSSVSSIKEARAIDYLFFYLSCFLCIANMYILAIIGVNDCPIRWRVEASRVSERTV